jgi:hypothetical protein
LSFTQLLTGNYQKGWGNYEWRWMLDRNDSPWYPTARLFRQKTINDWEGVFKEVKQALKMFPVAANKFEAL